MIKVGQKYRHYKDPAHIYEVIALPKHSETLEDMVVYKAMYEGNPVSDCWARPISMWRQTVQWDSKTVPRFTLVEEE